MWNGIKCSTTIHSQLPEISITARQKKRRGQGETCRRFTHPSETILPSHPHSGPPLLPSSTSSSTNLQCSALDRRSCQRPDFTSQSTLRKPRYLAAMGRSLKRKVHLRSGSPFHTGAILLCRGSPLVVSPSPPLLNRLRKRTISHNQ